MGQNGKLYEYLDRASTSLCVVSAILLRQYKEREAPLVRRRWRRNFIDNSRERDASTRARALVRPRRRRCRRRRCLRPIN